MLKKTENMIATIEALLGRPSEQKLNPKDLRLLIHNAVEQYSARAIKEREDWWTHFDDVTVAYVTDENHYTFTLGGGITEFKPINVWYQPLTADRNVGDWVETSLVPLDAYPDESRRNQVVIAFYGNNFDGMGSLRALINITDSYADAQRWRIQYRRLSTTAPQIGGTVPFPPEYASLIEYAVAEEAITMINDDSPKAQMYLQKRLPSLMKRRMELEADFVDSIKRDPKVRKIRAVPYDYRNRRGYRTSHPFKVE